MRLQPMLLCGLVALLGTSSADAGRRTDSKVNIVNHSNWAIHELYLSSVDDDNWGRDQLQEHIIDTGESFLLRRIPCDAYDVRLVDEDGDACVVQDVELCAGNGTWTITNDYLLRCQAATDE